MQILTSITATPNQKMQIQLVNNESIDFRIYYFARMQSWYYDFTYKDFVCKGLKVVLSPNSIRQFRKILPFGFMINADSLVQPFSIDDFASGRVIFGVLNAEEVKQIEKEIYNANA